MISEDNYVGLSLLAVSSTLSLFAYTETKMNPTIYIHQMNSAFSEIAQLTSRDDFPYITSLLY
jgi:hypothetical protein